MKYLTSLFSEVYLKDIVERKKIERVDVFEQILDLLCSSIGSLTNPTKIANTLKSKTNGGISVVTVASYIEHLEGEFCFLKASDMTLRVNHILNIHTNFTVRTLDCVMHG